MSKEKKIFHKEELLNNLNASQRLNERRTEKYAFAQQQRYVDKFNETFTEKKPG